MRAILRRTLLLLVAAALVAPLTFSGDAPAAQIPVCCLGKGEHHCLGEMLGSGGAPGFSAAVAKCPYSNLALSAMHGPELAAPVSVQTGAPITRGFFVAFQQAPFVASGALLAEPERGPPSSSL